MAKKALIAMSGGVDSSVAAYLMKEAGYDCIGVTMKLYDNEDIGMEREKTCCSLSAHQAAEPLHRFRVAHERLTLSTRLTMSLMEASLVRPET